MNGRRWGTLMFTLTGMGASGYLTYTHLANVAPQCAGLGDCALVQASSYAMLFGIPIALLGFLAYLVMLALAAAAYFLLDEERGILAQQALFGLALVGTLYSAYLTFIEAFVLRAYCIYCLISAISITAICILVGIDVFSETGVLSEIAKE